MEIVGAFEHVRCITDPEFLETILEVALTNSEAEHGNVLRDETYLEYRDTVKVWWKLPNRTDIERSKPDIYLLSPTDFFNFVNSLIDEVQTDDRV